MVTGIVVISQFVFTLNYMYLSDSLYIMSYRLVQLADGVNVLRDVS